MKILIRFISIIGLVSMSHVAVAIDDVADGDVLTADTMNEIIDATNANSAGSGLDFDIELPCGAGGTQYSVGDTGPAGGLVFVTTADGCNGLEAWTADEGLSLWGCEVVSTNATGTAIGTGAPNTALIINQGCTNGGNAADLTRLRNEGGETDWYLPSLDELLEMYNSIGPGGGNAGGFDATAVYWTSSEKSQLDVHVVNFANGNVVINPKNFNRQTRAIRTFNQP